LEYWSNGVLGMSRYAIAQFQVFQYSNAPVLHNPNRLQD
jgi:hypothetical protein